VATSTLSSFSTRIRLQADGVVENADKAVRKAGFAVDQAVVLGTPVDKGVARSNWLVFVAPVFGEVAAEGGGKDGFAELVEQGRDGVQSLLRPAAALAQAAGTIRARRTGQDLWIVNNIDYIGKLNAGSSQQAPENFVEMAVMDGVRAVRSVKVVNGN